MKNMLKLGLCSLIVMPGLAVAQQDNGAEQRHVQHVSLSDVKSQLPDNNYLWLTMATDQAVRDIVNASPYTPDFCSHNSIESDVCEDALIEIWRLWRYRSNYQSWNEDRWNWLIRGLEKEAGNNRADKVVADLKATAMPSQLIHPILVGAAEFACYDPNSSESVIRNCIEEGYLGPPAHSITRKPILTKIAVTPKVKAALIEINKQLAVQDPKYKESLRDILRGNE